MISRKTSFALGAVAAIVIAGTGTAVAATGGTLTLGKKNAATATTTLGNSKGTPLSLEAKKGAAPLKVNRATKVKNLNADLLDGLSASDFALKSGATGYVVAESVWYDADQDGTDDSLWAIAVCPKGTKLTGGGAENYTGNGTPVDAPADSNGWVVASVATPGTDTEDEVYGYAICYNPAGKVKGASPTLAAAHAKSHSTGRTVPQAQLGRFAQVVAAHR